MEVSISNSPLRLPAIISRHRKASYQINRMLPKNPTTRYIKSANFPLECSPNKLNRPIGLYGENRTPKSLLFGQHKLNFIQARAELGEAQPEAAGPNSNLAEVLHFGSICYKFIRPYAMLQVIISSVSFFARVLVENPQLFKWSMLLKAFPGLIAMILAHSYTYGINQIFDADIDRVNKPYLPIPAGDISLTQAWLLMTFFVLSGQLILWLMNADPITTCLYCFGLILATIYSAPPFRLKRSAIATIITIPLSTIINNVGVIYATMASLGLPFRLSPPVVFILTFNALFFVVTCLIKDIEDVQGDMRHGIQTFAAMFGPKNMTLLGMGILLANYIGALAVAIYMPQAFKWHIIFPAHSILVSWLLFQARELDKANYVKEASANFYQFLWKLLTLEFLLFPFI